LAETEKIFSRFGNGKKLVLKEIAKDGLGQVVHQKDDEKGNFKKNFQEKNRRSPQDSREMKRKGLR